MEHENDPEVKLADMLWQALWEEPERPAGKLWLWLVGGGFALIVVIAYFVTKK